MTYTPEQQAENRAKWVEALRSGKYKQGRHQLRLVNEDESVSYCCLGVACEISGLDDWWRDDYLGRTTSLPPAVCDWLGLTSGLGEVPDLERNLATLNDGRGYTFSQIADLIEQGMVETV